MRGLSKYGVGIACTVGFIVASAVDTSYAAPYQYASGASRNAYSLSKEAITSLVYSRAEAHGADPALLLCVLRYESRLDPNFIGSRGEVGLAQWLPGRGNAWDATLAYKVSGISIFKEYANGNPDAIYFDVDAMAEMFARGRATRRQHWYSTLRFCE